MYGRVQDFIYRYSNRPDLKVSLDRISLDGSAIASEYLKENGVIYPISSSGTVALDATNTPRIAAGALARLQNRVQVLEDREAYATAIHAFSGSIALLAAYGSLMPGIHSVAFKLSSRRPSGGGAPKSARWEDFLSAAKQRVAASKAKYGAGDATMLAEGRVSKRSILRDAGSSAPGLPGGKQSSGPFRFLPKESWRPTEPLRRSDGGGYIDRFGNVWQEGPYHRDPAMSFNYEWDVQLSSAGKAFYKARGVDVSKGYINVRPDGYLSH